MKVGIGLVQKNKAGWSGKQKSKDEQHLMEPATRGGNIQWRQAAKSSTVRYAFQILSRNIGRTAISGF